MEAVSLGMERTAGSRKVLVGSIILALVAGLALGLLIGKQRGGAERSPETAIPSDAGPTSEINGVPVGYARTEEGAVLAATNFGLVSTSDLIRDRDAYMAAARTLAAESWRSRAEEQATNSYEFAVENYGRDIEISSAVLRYQVLSFSQDEARVRLWTVTVVSGSKRPAPEAVWGTSIVDLVWADDDWRVAATDDQAGPVPAAVQRQEDGAALRRLLEESSAFREAPRP